MSLADASTLLESLFKEEWDGAIPVEWPGAPFEPAAGAPYVRFGLREGAGEVLELGPDSPERHAGLVVVDVFLPEALPARRGAEMADRIAAIFSQRDLRSTSNDIRCRVASVRPLQPAQTGWQQLPVIIPYERDSPALPRV